MKYEDVTEQIIGCAYRVYNTMGFGFLESVYEKWMMIELARAGLSVSAQQTITVSYQGETVGEFVADLIVYLARPLTRHGSLESQAIA